MILSCWVIPWWTITASPRKSQEAGETRNVIYQYSHLGNLSPECFHFLLLRTGSLIGLRGLSKDVVKLQRFLFVPGHQITASAATRVVMPPRGPLRYSCLMSQSRSPTFPENPKFWGDRVTEGKRPHSLVLWERFIAPYRLVAAEEWHGMLVSFYRGKKTSWVL